MNFWFPGPRFPAMAAPTSAGAWRQEAARRLEALVQAAAGLDPAARVGRPEDREARARAVTAAAEALMRFVERQPGPANAPGAEAELRAAAGVLRNAAVAYRNLDPAAGPGDPLVDAGLALLEQGRHHAQAFRSAAGL